MNPAQQHWSTPPASAAELLERVEMFYAGAPDRWTKGGTARDASGTRVGGTAATACAWCLSYALMCCWHPGGTLVDPFDRSAVVPRAEILTRARTALELAAGEQLGAQRVPLVTFNDRPGTTFARVLEVIVRARELEASGALERRARRVAGGR